MVTLSILSQLDLATASDVAHAAGDVASPFIFRLSIFVLAVFVGYFVVWSVTPALHTPLVTLVLNVSAL